MDVNDEQVAARKNEYRRRQAIVEHPFGTIKRQWGFNHIITKKGIPAASADFGLMALAYNLKRMFNLNKNRGKTTAGHTANSNNKSRLKTLIKTSRRFKIRIPSNTQPTQEFQLAA